MAPRLPGPRVDLRGYPGYRVGANTPGFDASRGPFQAVSQGADDAQEIVGQEVRAEEREREKARQVATVDFTTKLQMEDGRLRGELQKVGGQDVLKASSDTVAAFEKFYRDNTKTVTDPELQRRYRMQFDQYKASLHRYATSYGEGKYQEFQNERSDALVENEIAAAAQNWFDPDRVQLAEAQAWASIEAQAERNGKPAEWAQDRQRRALSRLHEGVVNKMLAAGQVANAKAYREKHKELLSGSPALDRAIADSDELESAQKAVDGVMGSASLKDALGKIDALAEGKEPRWRERARDLLKERWNDVAVADRLEQEGIFERIAEAYEADPSRDVQKIDPVGYERLKTKYRTALKKLAVNDDQNDGLFLDFMGKPLDEVASLTPAQFQAEVWSQLPSKGDQRNQARERWVKARDAKDKPEARVRFNGIINTEEQIRRALFGIKDLGFEPGDTLEKLKGDTSKSAKEKLATWERFRADVNTVMAGFAKDKNRNPDDEETQKIIDNLLLKRVFFDGKERPLVLVPPERFGEAYVPLEKIPQRDADFIRGILQSKGKKVTDDKLQRIYMAFQLNDKPGAMRIMDE